jgi:hypothetical protein
MVDLSLSMRVRRGFHRMGIFVATMIGLGASAIGIYWALDDIHLQQARYLALRCADKNLEKQPQIIPSGPWDKYKTPPKDELTISSSGETWPGRAVTKMPNNDLPDAPWVKKWDVTLPDGTEYEVTAPADKLEKDILAAVQTFHTTYGRVDVAKLGCGDSFGDGVLFSEILESRSGFSYSAALASHLGLSFLAAVLLAATSYLLFFALGWIVSGFMRD